MEKNIETEGIKNSVMLGVMFMSAMVVALVAFRAGYVNNNFLSIYQ